MGKAGNASDLAALLGVSKAAVSKAIKCGRLSESVKPADTGRGYVVDLDAAVIEWTEKNGRPDLSGVDHRSVSVRLDKRKAAPLEIVPAPSLPNDIDDLLAGAPLDDDDSDDDGIPSSIKSRKIIDHYKAQQAKLDYMVSIGTMVPVEEVGQAVGREYASVRASLLSIPARIAEEVATCETALDARMIIEAAITEALNALTADAETEPSVRAA